MGPAEDATGSVGRATEIGMDTVGEMLSWTGDGGVPSTIAEPHLVKFSCTLMQSHFWTRPNDNDTHPLGGATGWEWLLQCKSSNPTFCKTKARDGWRANGDSLAWKGQNGMGDADGDAKDRGAFGIDEDKDEISPVAPRTAYAEGAMVGVWNCISDKDRGTCVGGCLTGQ